MSDPTDATPTRASQLTTLIVDAVAKAISERHPEIFKGKWDATSTFMESMEDEMAPIMRDALGHLATNDDLPDNYRRLFQLMTEPEHQTDWLLQMVGLLGMVIAVLPSLGRIEMQPMMNAAWTDHPEMPMSPADAADAVVRNIWTFDEAHVEALYSGIDRPTFQTMVDLTGEPPGPVDMLGLWRRGAITEEFLEHAIRYSRIRDEFIPAVKLLAHSYISPEEVIELAIKQIVDLDTAKKMYKIAGGLEDQFSSVYQAAGNSIGPAEAMTLWNHKLITETDVEKALGRSRLNPIFYNVAKLQRHHWLNPHQIEVALKGGALDPAEATKWLLEDGLPPDQVAAFVKGAHAATAAKPKSETEAMIVKQYVDHLLDETQAHAALVQIGYSVPLADAILATADASRAHAQLNGAITKVKNAYLAGHLSEATAKVDLDKLGVPAKARDQWIIDWGVESSAELKTFTMAQIGSFAKGGLISYDDARGRWVAMGYSDIDAKILSAHYGDKSIPIPVKL